MSGFCSAHQHHEPECRQCEIGERVKALEIFALKMIQNTKPLDPEFSKVVDEHFWELADYGP